jgi:hypothetical protein
LLDLDRLEQDALGDLESGKDLDGLEDELGDTLDEASGDEDEDEEDEGSEDVSIRISTAP